MERAATRARCPVASDVSGEAVGCVGDGANRSILRPTRVHTLHRPPSLRLSISLPLWSFKDDSVGVWDRVQRLEQLFRKFVARCRVNWLSHLPDTWLIQLRRHMLLSEFASYHYCMALSTGTSKTSQSSGRMSRLSGYYCTVEVSECGGANKPPAGKPHVISVFPYSYASGQPLSARVTSYTLNFCYLLPYSRSDLSLFPTVYRTPFSDV